MPSSLSPLPSPLPVYERAVQALDPIAESAVAVRRVGMLAAAIWEGMKQRPSFDSMQSSSVSIRSALPFRGFLERGSSEAAGVEAAGVVLPERDSDVVSPLGREHQGVMQKAASTLQVKPRPSHHPSTPSHPLQLTPPPFQTHTHLPHHPATPSHLFPRMPPALPLSHPLALVQNRFKVKCARRPHLESVPAEDLLPSEGELVISAAMIDQSLQNLARQLVSFEVEDLQATCSRCNHLRSAPSTWHTHTHTLHTHPTLQTSHT